MAYVEHLINRDEKLVGIARLHWIYVLKGLVWFVVLAWLGAASEALVMRTIAATNAAVESVVVLPRFTILSDWLMSLAQSVNSVQAGIGLLIFAMHVLKVWVTEVALTDRRVIYRKGLFSVKVAQIDLEEIRGERLDFGMFGRFLRYGRIKLDCRFVGDVRLPAIAHADTFIKALHHYRSHTQEVLSVAIGDTKPAKLQIVEASAQQPEPPPVRPVTPPEPVQPVPEIEPAKQPPQPEIQPPPTAAAAQAEIVAQAVAEAVEKVVPRIVEKMAEQGAIAVKPAANDEKPADEELLVAFDGAAYKTEARSVAEGDKPRRVIH